MSVKPFSASQLRLEGLRGTHLDERFLKMSVCHFTEMEWDGTRWPNFSPAELACRHCGEVYFSPDDFDAVQALRDELGRPVMVNSAHRCALHNAQVGGAVRSQHRRIAFDIALAGHECGRLLAVARAVGFTGFGFYGTFLHLDRGRARQWVSRKGEQTWADFLT